MSQIHVQWQLEWEAKSIFERGISSEFRAGRKFDESAAKREEEEARANSNSINEQTNGRDLDERKRPRFQPHDRRIDRNIG